MKKILYTLALIALCQSAAWGQSPQELLRFSRHNFSFATARSAAMGGAFTSLGADGISLSQNPAGLAMYSAPEISISPALRISNISTAFGPTNNGTQSNTKPIIGNFAAIYANGNGNGWAWGIGMNRLGDFAGKYTVTGDYSPYSKAYIYRDQLEGIALGTLSGNGAYNRPPAMWNAVLANSTYLVNPVNNVPGNTKYTLDGVLERGDNVVSQLNSNTNGAVDEIDFSAAYNHKGIIYFGFSLGMQSLYYRQNTAYSEFADLDYNQGQLDSYQERENLALDGFGLNLKLGVTVRPVKWLRIGVAYHSPTWISMDENSNRDMATWWRTSSIPSRDDYTPDLRQNYNYQTPSRLMAGVSFTIARRVIITADYERTWYKSMQYTTRINQDGWRAPITPTDVDNNPIIVGNYMNQRGDIDMNGIIRDSYRTTNNIRAGIEYQPTNGLFLRAGYAYSQSPYAAMESTYKKGELLSHYDDLEQYSGGVGYRTSRFGIDLAYVYAAHKAIPSVFYDYVASDGIRMLPEANIYKQMQDHNIILTFAWRF